MQDGACGCGGSVNSGGMARVAEQSGLDLDGACGCGGTKLPFGMACVADDGQDYGMTRADVAAGLIHRGMTRADVAAVS